MAEYEELAKISAPFFSTLQQAINLGVKGRHDRDVLNAQREINSQNMAFQRSATRDKYNELVGLGMSRQAALQAVSGASYSPSSVFQATEAPQVDFSTIGQALRDSAQLEQQAKLNEAQVDLLRSQTEGVDEDNFMKRFDRESQALLNDVYAFIQRDPNIGFDNLQSVESLSKALPKDLQAKFDANAQVQNAFFDFFDRRLEHDLNNARLGLFISQKEGQEIANRISKFTEDELKEDWKYLPELKKLDYKMFKENYKLFMDPKSISLRKGLVELGLSNVNIDKLYKQIEERLLNETDQDKIDNLVKWRQWIAPFVSEALRSAEVVGSVGSRFISARRPINVFKAD